MVARQFHVLHRLVAIAFIGAGWYYRHGAEVTET